MTQQLRDTFIAHEYLAPDADLALEAIEHRIDARRRNRLAVGGVVAAVAAVIAGVAFVAGSPHRSGTQPGSGIPPAYPAIAPGAVTATATIAPGWLPPGKVTRQAVFIHVGTENLIYKVAPTHGSAVFVNIGRFPESILPRPDPAKRAAGTDTQFNGRPAREWSSAGNYEFAFLLPGHGWASVNVTPDGRSTAAQLRQIGRHVAATMRFDRHDKVPTTPQVALHHVPAGLAVRFLETQNDDDARIALARPTADTPASDVERWLNITVTRSSSTFTPGTDSGHITTSRGRLVNGHQTWLQRARPGATIPDMSVTLQIPNVDGYLLTISGGQTVRSVDELYRIADGIALP